MSEFEEYSTELLYSAKKFYHNGAKKDCGRKERQRCFRASVTHAFFFLESQVNYIAEHFLTNPNIGLLERSLLSERDLQLKSGAFTLSQKEKFFRLEDRIDFLLVYFSGTDEPLKADWKAHLQDSIRLRNRLVHPRDAHSISEEEVRECILSCLHCVEALYKQVFNKPFPFSSMGTDLGPSTN